jgi:hypothetical protein
MSWWSGLAGLLIMLLLGCCGKARSAFGVDGSLLLGERGPPCHLMSSYLLIVSLLAMGACGVWVSCWLLTCRAAGSIGGAFPSTGACSGAGGGYVWFGAEFGLLLGMSCFFPLFLYTHLRLSRCAKTLFCSGLRVHVLLRYEGTSYITLVSGKLLVLSWRWRGRMSSAVISGIIALITIFVNLGFFRHFETVTHIRRTWINSHRSILENVVRCKYFEEAGVHTKNPIKHSLISRWLR